jgi:hypothetical protein
LTAVAGHRILKPSRTGGLVMPKPDVEQRKVVVLELVAASAIFGVVAIVLYMVFSYKPL